ncbi:MAG: ABC transporter ATP-binding protein [Treponema sp.]|jgi:osmoprotectant transport system ATP-binding protein|nr:ABC transporter ATP-binding protein [Treponema sp.]
MIVTVVSFKHITKRFANAASNAINDVSFSIEEGEFVTIIGTSGCGKTTLLKMVNRLVDYDSGDIYINETHIKDTDPVKLRHNIGYVIQQSGLFPHMTVFENVAVVPKLLKWDKARIAKRVKELLELVNLDYAEFHKRHPAELSGGQQQRVGLARALAVDPAILLLDEPFGAIDAINRVNLQSELLRIHRLQKDAGALRTYLFVTHDINEALKLGTRTLVMHQGAVMQFDSPGNLLRQPANDFVRALLSQEGVYTGVGEGI